MRTAIRPFLPLLLAAFALTTQAQNVHFSSKGGSDQVDLLLLREGLTAVPGQGRHVPGVDLDEIASPRMLIGDDPHAMDRGPVDSLWADLAHSRDSVVADQGVHWVRYHMSPLDELHHVPLMLRVGAHAPFEVFLDGLPLIRSPGQDPTARSAGFPGSDSLLLVGVPFTFRCDGRPEVIAIQVKTAPGASIASTGLTTVLQLAETGYDLHRRMVHFGVFLGINVVILLLALVIWFSDRREKSWLLLALLSLVSAFDIFGDVGASMGLLGFAGTTAKVLVFLKAVLIPWPMYLLIVVLGTLHGDLSRKRIRRYTIGTVLLTGICITLGVALITGIIDTSKGFLLVDDRPSLLVLLFVLGGIFIGVWIWFAIVAVRLAIRLVRSKGYARWIGGGALASSLLAIALKLGGGFVGTGLSLWLGLIADYCSYVAVPVSIALYLAIRSAHHNKLVARQRDELDLEVKERTAELSAEKERSDELLLNILPAEVAEELKRTGAAEARHFAQATVMFTDFKGFTTLAEQVDATELLQELNTCFKAFDDIIGARGIEKIKTIGDAYMCAGGLPDPNTSTPADVVRAALAMQAFIRGRKAEREAQGRPAFEMRIGIHTGPVVAGIVGVKKFQYDIWGDTVNTASRMESSGEVGQVNISEATYSLVKDEPGLSFTPRGKVQAKGKGEMEMYFVTAAG